MMRRKSRPDSNQVAIITALREKGASVLLLHQLGKGCPDFLLGWRGCNYLIEIKDGSKPPSQRKLTPDEREFVTNWRGNVHIIETVGDAIAMLDQLYSWES